MINRVEQSKFLDNLEVSSRGIVKIASSMLPGTKDTVTHKQALNVLKSFENNSEISKEALAECKQEVELSNNPGEVVRVFLVGVKIASKLTIATAKTLRQNGMFKSAGRGVYEDLETGDFWKISEDKKHVIRLFKEDEQGIADKRASINLDNLDDTLKNANIEDNKVFDMLFSNDFKIWYKKDFADFISGEEKAKSKEEILKDIENMLR
jgi:hypothetical protein